MGYPWDGHCMHCCRHTMHGTVLHGLVVGAYSHSYSRSMGSTSMGYPLVASMGIYGLVVHTGASTVQYGLISLHIAPSTEYHWHMGWLVGEYGVCTCSAQWQPSCGQPTPYGGIWAGYRAWTRGYTGYCTSGTHYG